MNGFAPTLFTMTLDMFVASLARQGLALLPAENFTVIYVELFATSLPPYSSLEKNNLTPILVIKFRALHNRGY
jgi:hypothetical protein